MTCGGRWWRSGSRHTITFISTPAVLRRLTWRPERLHRRVHRLTAPFSSSIRRMPAPANILRRRIGARAHTDRCDEAVGPTQAPFPMKGMILVLTGLGIVFLASAVQTFGTNWLGQTCPY